MASISYMHLRGGTYHFRKRLPEALAGREAPPHVRSAHPRLVNSKTGRFKIEVTESLRTKDPKTAKRHDLRMAAEVHEMIEDAERLLASGPPKPSGPMMPASRDLPPLADIEAEYVRELLELDERDRTSGDAKRGLQTEQEREELRRRFPSGSQHPEAGLVDFGPEFMMGEAHHFIYGEHLQDELELYRRALARRDYTAVEAAAQVFFGRRSEHFDPRNEAHRGVALALLKAAVKATCMMIERQDGNDVPTPAPLPQKQGPTISEAFEHWRRPSAAKGGRQIASNTLREASHAVRLFEGWTGDKPLGAITKEDTRTFRDALERRPTGLPAHLRALPLRELLARDLKDYPACSATTVNKLLNILKAIVRRAEKDGLTDPIAGFANPFRDVRSEVDERREEGREPFDAEDLKAMFGTPVFISGLRPRGGGREAAFWLPVLALLTGARQEELAQLRVCDVKKDLEADVWFLDIGTTGDRRVKTVSSRRRVPLHSALGRIGFLRYLEACSGGRPKDAPLWPDIKSDITGKRSAAWSKWFGRYLRETAGVTDPRKVFHSFRHTFKRMARSADLSEELHDALTGHASGGGVGRAYGRGFDLRALSQGVEKIEAPAVVSALRWDPMPPHGGNLADVASEGTSSSDV